MRAEQGQAVPSRSVIICSTPRSGSWLLAELLELTGVCGHPREYFRPDYEAIYAREWGLAPSWSFPQYVAAVKRAGSTANGVFAMKLHRGQYEHLVRRLSGAKPCLGGEGLALLAQHFPRPTFVLLRRADKAAQAVSWFRAIRADRWWDVGDPASVAETDAPPDLFEIGRLEQALREQEQRWDEAFSTCALPTVVLEYEAFSADYATTARMMVDTLGLAVEPPARPARLRKQADTRSAAWIREYLDWRSVAACEPR